MAAGDGITLAGGRTVTRPQLNYIPSSKRWDDTSISGRGVT